MKKKMIVLKKGKNVKIVAATSDCCSGKPSASQINNYLLLLILEGLGSPFLFLWKR